MHAPHCRSPQPYFAPVSPRSSRSTSKSGRSGSVVTVCGWPLMLSVSVCSMIRLHSLLQAGSLPSRLAPHCCESPGWRPISSPLAAGAGKLSNPPRSRKQYGIHSMALAAETNILRPTTYGKIPRHAKSFDFSAGGGGFAGHIGTAATSLGQIRLGDQLGGPSSSPLAGLEGDSRVRRSGDALGPIHRRRPPTGPRC